MKTLNFNKKKGIFDEIFESGDNIDELEFYLNEPPLNVGPNFDVMEYWLNRKESPLQVMAIDILSIPASSTSVERLFSSAKMDDCKLRLSLDPMLKGKMQVAKSWYILEEKIKCYNVYCVISVIIKV